MHTPSPVVPSNISPEIYASATPLERSVTAAHSIHSRRRFKKLDWSEVFYKRLSPPWIPKISTAGDSCKH